MSDRVNVVDLYNKNRVLGSLPRPDMRGGLRHYQMPVYSPARLSTFQYDAPIVSCFDVILFELVVVEEDGGWTLRRVLGTGAPLKDLMMVREFRLPGEDDFAAAKRHYYY